MSLYGKTTFMIFVLFSKTEKALKKNTLALYCLTYLCRVDGDHRAEGTLSFAVVSAHLHMKRREGRDAVVAVHVA